MLRNRRHKSDGEYIQVSPKNRTMAFVADDYENNFVDIQASLTRNLHVIKKRDEPILLNMNEFLWESIEKYFKLSGEKRWSYNRDHHQWCNFI